MNELYPKIAELVNLYDQGVISHGKAAELAGLPRSEFLQLLEKHKVSAIQYTPELLDEELNQKSPVCL